MKQLRVKNAYSEGQGLYVAVLPTRKTITRLAQSFLQHMRFNPSDLHVTVAYSDPVLPSVVTDILAKGKQTYQATPLSVSWFGDYLVIELDSPDLVTRHDQWIAAGATHSYPQYKPHVSIACGSLTPTIEQYIRQRRRNMPTGLELEFGQEFAECVKE